MKQEKIKPIPKYIVKRIKAMDKKDYVTASGRTRFYAYLTKNDGELVKVTVAVRNYYSQWHYKQVAVHGLRSDKCFVKDMVFYYIAGYQVGWYEQGLQKGQRWYESTEWGWQIDKMFDPYAPIVNREYLDNFPEYKYSAVNLYQGVDILKYLRFYERYPQMEYLMKAGLSDYVFLKQILQKIGKNKRFCKWLMANRNEIAFECYYVSTILTAFQKSKTLKETQIYESAKKTLCSDKDYKPIREMLNGDYARYFTYISTQGLSNRLYLDYLKACNYLNLDMSESKNRYPHDFKRWHDIRIDEYHTAKALKEEQNHKELYVKFETVAKKYLGLQYDKNSVYVAIIAQNPNDLVKEGDALHHCVGRMGYDQKFIREESLIFFIRMKESPDVPLVTVEYSPTKKKILQCYGDHDGKPTQEIMTFVNEQWLPYANKKLKRLAA